MRYVIKISKTNDLKNHFLLHDIKQKKTEERQ